MDPMDDLRGGIVRVVPADDLADDLSVYRPFPYSYAETARSEQRVVVGGVVSQFGRSVRFGEPPLGDTSPADATEPPTPAER